MCDTARAMSSITIASLPRMARETLSAIIQTPAAASNLAIIDVRDSGSSVHPLISLRATSN